MAPSPLTDAERVRALGYALGCVSTYIEAVSRAARDVYQEQRPADAYGELCLAVDRIRAFCGATPKELVELRERDLLEKSGS